MKNAASQCKSLDGIEKGDPNSGGSSIRGIMRPTWMAQSLGANDPMIGNLGSATLARPAIAVWLVGEWLSGILTGRSYKRPTVDDLAAGDILSLVSMVYRRTVWHVLRYEVLLATDRARD
jgi:hypothetical protein